MKIISSKFPVLFKEERRGSISTIDDQRKTIIIRYHMETALEVLANGIVV